MFKKYQVAPKVKQTAIILSQTDDIEYYLIGGDYTHLSEASYNTKYEGDESAEELKCLFNNGEADKNCEPISLEDFREALLSPDTVLIQCWEDN